ncbi:MAG: high-potential iron-sulfur protein [Saprospiraceae bacterium]|nr:high-potential iron-sulfur protein [Saprospiraceae bacterium]
MDLRKYNILPDKRSSSSRRNFIGRLFSAWIWLGLGSIFGGCLPKKEKEMELDALDVERCDDLSKVSEEEMAKRNNLGYEMESSMPDKKCANCNLYIPPREGRSCGGCILFKGPVFENAYCTYWAPQVG